MANTQMERCPEVTSQMLIDGGLNAFAFELVAECFTRKKDFATWTGPMTFIFKGIQFTLQKPQPSTPAAPETAPPCPHVNTMGHEWESWCMDCGERWPNNLHRKSTIVTLGGDE